MTKQTKRYQRFFAELKRRRVFNSAAVYGGVAFIIFQAADFVVPALRLPESVSTGIVLVTIFLFPIAMVIAWFYDVTFGGMKLTDPPDPGELEAIAAQPALRRWPVGIFAALGVFLLLGGFGWRFMARSDPVDVILSARASATRSIAVLPFLNLTGVGDATYFSEGVAIELLQALRRVPGFQVTGRTSAFSFRGAGSDLRSVAEVLGVSSLVEGSVGETGDSVEIAVRLVSTDSPNQPWTRSFVLPKENFLDALDEVAWGIAGQLGAEGSAEGADPLVIPSTANFRAYRDYLRGRHLSYQSTPEALESAIEFYNRAILLDPEFSAAWGALATAYVLLPEYGGPPMAEILPYVQAALREAMKAGGETAEALAASGYLNWVYLWDLPVAEEQFLRSLELDPGNPISRYWYAEFLATERRWQESVAHVDFALELDPLSAAAHLVHGLVLFCAGLDGASASFRRALELAPTMYPASYVLAGVLAMEGDLEGAAEEFDRFSSLTGADPSPFRAYLAALSDPSKTPEAVVALQREAFFGPVQGAELLSHLGEYDAALTLLERGAQARSPYLPWVNAMPQYERLRTDPRFQGVLAWIGF
jgi:TolB-like protein